ncbi:MAG TPA: bifunctional acetate--CoA ligase family protein/GNAT family N-acetyltransferase [Terriglobia bacterium]|nr:bifunctional acetate--CoA ligase family protein/GNAT family N-acetyltransferase [Terriglobia bacterium]
MTTAPSSSVESIHDILRERRHPLDVFFKPSTVAVIGASETKESVGRSILWNLIGSPFGGTVFPVNPKRPSVLGIKSYPAISEVPGPVELAVIATPAQTVPKVVRDCAAAGVKGAIIISAGFKECGPEGVKLEAEILAAARPNLLRVIGPNCLGLMSPLTGLNATFAGAMARPGSVGFISQSGALCTAVLDWSLRENVGFSAFISIGSMLDVGWGDLIDYLGDDPQTRSIILYMESIGDPRAFISAARQVALSKPIIVIKAGRSEAAAKAAASHTGALAGRDEVLDAAFRRCGVLRVNTISELFHMADVLGKQPRPKGQRLAMITNAGGPGVLATDALIAVGGELAELSQETKDALNQFLSPHWSHGNPVDVLGDADPARYRKAVETVSRDPGNDGILVILAPQAVTDPTQTAEKLKDFAQLEGKPILASWMGGAQVSAGEAILSRNNIPTFSYPDAAARIFHSMWRYAYNLRALYETPAPVLDNGSGQEMRRSAAGIVQKARNAGRTILTEPEAKELLRAYGIPVVETRLAGNEDEAVKAANSLGYPVVLKLFSHTITHKTDVGGVRLHLENEIEVRQAYGQIESSVREKAGPDNFLGVTVQPMVSMTGYELIIGSTLDPQFGPVLLFGLGGQLVEVFKDHALALPPLNTTLARRLMEQTKIYKALQGVRGRKAVDLEALEELLVRFSEIVVDLRAIKEIEINPLLASGDGLVALDARAILHPQNAGDDQIPKLAIRPYPTRYVTSVAKDGLRLAIRPIRPEDEPLMVEFHRTLSQSTVYMRYFHMLSIGQRVSHKRLTRICFIDYNREMALVAVQQDASTGHPSIVGVGRLTKLQGVNEAEVALVVADSFHRRGIGTELLRRLIEVGRDERLDRITADILGENYAMQRVCEKLNFKLNRSPDGAAFHAIIDLRSS